MLTIRRNFGLLFVFIRRSIADCCLKGNKHYDFFIRHIKTDLNNHCYIVKQTTAIPKEKRNLNPICDRDKPYNTGPKTFNNPLLPFSNDTANIFLEKNVNIQDVVNTVATNYSMRENNLNKYEDTVEGVINSCSTNDIPSCYTTKNEHRDDIFENNNKEKESTQTNYHEDYIHPKQLNQIATSLHDNAISNESNSFSLVNIRELLSNKIKNLLTTNFNKNDIFSNDNMIVILNQRICETGRLLFFMNKDLHVIEFSHTNLENEVKNYIKKLDFNRSNKSASERINVVRFSKMYVPDTLFESSLNNSSFSKGHSLLESDSYFSKNSSCDLNHTAANSYNSLDNTILKIKNSVPLEQNTEKFWVPYEENSNNVREINRENFKHMTWQSYNEFSPHSGPPFTEKVPIKRDKLIEESVVPNTSILNIINSIDKSAVIIQKDLYITDRIITKIQKEEEEKNKVIDKNKLETTSKKGYVMYLDAPFIKNGMVTLSLTGLPTGTKELSSNDRHGELNISNNKQYLITTENSTKEKSKSLQQQSSTGKRNIDASQITGNVFNNNKQNGSPAFVTLSSIDNDGKISLNMLYEPNRVVPMFSFLSKKECTMGCASDIITRTLDNMALDDKHSGISHITQSHQSTSESKFKNNNKTEKCIHLGKNCVENPQHQLSSNNNANQISASKVSLPHKRISLDHQVNTTVNQTSITNENRLRLIENNFLQKKTVVNKVEKKKSKTLTEEPSYTIPDKVPQKKLLKDYIPHKKIIVYDSCEISPGEGIPVDVYVSRCKTTNSYNNIHQSNMKNSLLKHTENKFPTSIEKSLKTLSEDHIPNKQTSDVNMSLPNGEIPNNGYIKNPNNSISNSQNNSFKQLLVSRGQIKNLENEFSKVNKLADESEKKKSPQTLSGVKESFFETGGKDYTSKKKLSVSNDLENESEKKNSETLTNEPSHAYPNAVLAAIKSLETLLKKYILNKEISGLNALQNKSEKEYSETSEEIPSNITHNVEPDAKQLEILRKNDTSVPYVLQNESIGKFSKTPEEEPRLRAEQFAEPNGLNFLEIMPKNYISHKKNVVPNVLKNESEKQYTETAKTESSHITQYALVDAIKSLETFLKNYVSNEGIFVSENLKNRPKNKCLETPKQDLTYTAQNISPEIVKSLETWLNSYIFNRKISVSNVSKSDHKIKCSETLKKQPTHIAQNISPNIVKSMETFLKEYNAKKEISVSDVLRNETGKKCSETPKVESKAQNAVLDIITSLETLLKDKVLKREKCVSNSLENEIEKKYLETNKEEPNYRAQNKVSDVFKLLKTCLKEIQEGKMSVSNNLNDSEKKYSDTALEETSHQTQIAVPDIMNSLEILLKEYFSKTETPVSKTNSPNEGTPIDYQVNPNTHSEENSYELSNTTNIEFEGKENDFLKEEKITQESEKKNLEIYEEEPCHNVELLSKKERSVPNINYPVEHHEYVSKPNNTETNSKDKKEPQDKNRLLCMNGKKLPNDNIQESNNKSQHTLTGSKNWSQLNLVDSSNEANDKLVANKKVIMDTSRSISEESSNYQKREIISGINSLGRESDEKVLHKNNTHPNLLTVMNQTNNNASNQQLLMKSDGLLSGLSSVSGNSGKGSFNDGKNVEKLNVVSAKKQLESSNTNNSSVDCVKKTTISTVEKNNFTDINVSEVETYVDSRLPIPFSTETFFQIFGSNHSLRDHSYLIDVAKFKLTSPNKITEQRPNLSIMAKLDDIQKRVRYLNVLATNSKSLENKDTILKNEVLVPSKKVSKSSVKNQVTAKDDTKEYMQYNKISKKRKEESTNEGNVSNSFPKFSLKIFQNNLPIKVLNLKEMNKQKLQNQNSNTSEIKKEDHKASSKDEKSLLVVEPTNENIKEIKMDGKKPGIQKAALTGIRISKGKYIDLFNFNKNEKNKTQTHEGPKKGVFNHRGLSKRDKKILREITKEIPKKKLKRRSSRKLSIRSITREKNENESEQSTKSVITKSKDVSSNVTLPKKDSESVNKTVLPNTQLSNKQKLLPAGKHSREKQEVQKTFTNKTENTFHKVIPSVGQKSIVNKKSLNSEREKLKDIKLDKLVEKIKILESKSTKAERFNVSKTENLKQVTESDKISSKNSESMNYGGNTDKIGKPLCQTYVATETYVNQTEKAYLIPEKISTSKKIFKTNPTLQKVTILENSKTNKEENSNTLKIHEGFKEELIRKSQNKIEHRTNIDYRVKTPKLKNPKSKVITFKSNQKGKIGSAVLEKTPILKKDEKKSDIKNQHLVPKRLVPKNRLDSATSKEIRSTKKTITPKIIASVQNIKNEELHKINQLEPPNKETFLQPKSKTAEIVNIKPSDKMAKGTEKQENEQLKIVASDQLKTPIEPKIGKKATKTGPSENIDLKNFPILLIDVDKMSKEIKPELDLRNCQKCQIAHDKISDFPLHNQKKKLLFKPPFKILNLGPSNDPMLRNELKLFPSVTKVLNSTIPENSRETLREWRKSMIDQLGENGFKSFYRGQLINGSKFNWQLHNFLLCGDKHKQDSNNLSLKSIENVLERTSDLSAINSHVIHRKLAYRGVIDCVAKYQKKPVLIEWKRLENPHMKIPNSSIDVAATQLSAYVGALNYDDTYKFQISGGLIVLAYSDGSEAEVIEINNEQCNKHWKMWLRRLQTYHELSRKRAK